MLSSIYLNIFNKIKEKININEETILKVLHYMQDKPLNSYVYPEVITETFNIDLNTCLKLLILLENNSIIKQVYKIYCPICKDFSYDVFNSINELNSYEYCEDCGKKLIEKENPSKYLVIFFKVIKVKTDE